MVVRGVAHAVGLSIITVAMLATLPSASRAAERFDLFCRPTDGSGTPRHYRIDLAARRWCLAECQVAFPIQSVDADNIVLTKSDAAERERIAEHYISRTDGTYYDSYGQSALNLYMVAKGTCEPAPFSGLPEPKF